MGNRILEKVLVISSINEETNFDYDENLDMHKTTLTGQYNVHMREADNLEAQHTQLTVNAEQADQMRVGQRLTLIVEGN